MTINAIVSTVVSGAHKAVIHADGYVAVYEAMSDDCWELYNEFYAHGSIEQATRVVNEFFGLANPDVEQVASAAVESIKIGEYVKRKADANKVYKRGAYDASTKRYSLEDTDDMNREVFVKKGTVLFVGFTY